MGIRVNATEAAALVDRSERRVREWIRQGKLKASPAGPRAKVEHTGTGPTAWQIDVDDLAAVPGVVIDRDRLAEMEADRGTRSPGGLLARLEQTEARMRSLEVRLRALEARQPSLAAPSGDVPTLQAQPSESYYSAFSIDELHRLPPAPSPRHTEAYIGTGSGTFRSRADAQRWLMRHGIHSEATPKSWPTWRDVALEPEDVLRLALSQMDLSNHRINWRLHPCGDPACVCHTLLAG